MCLILAASCPSSVRDQLEAAAIDASSTGLRIEVGHSIRWPWASGRPVRATISEQGGCACSLLGDDADWNSESWAMRPEILEPLASVIEGLCRRIPSGLQVEALWVGEAPRETVRVSPERLIAIVRASHMGTRSRYVVEAEHAG